MNRGNNNQSLEPKLKGLVTGDESLFRGVSPSGARRPTIGAR